MKKKILSVLIMSILVISMLTGCCISHDWEMATCENPKTCVKCEETEGAPLGHNWNVATCEIAKTCDRCGKTEGNVLGHDWKEATCENPKTCNRCGKTEGGVVEHNLSNSGRCTNCNKQIGYALNMSNYKQYIKVKSELGTSKTVSGIPAISIKVEPIDNVEFCNIVLKCQHTQYTLGSNGKSEIFSYDIKLNNSGYGSASWHARGMRIKDFKVVSISGYVIED